MSKTTEMIFEFIKKDLPGGKEILELNTSIGVLLGVFITILIAWFGMITLDYLIDIDIRGQNLNIQQLELDNNIKSILDVLFGLCIFGILLLILLGILVYYYYLNRADKAYKRAIENGYTPLPKDKPYISNARVNPDQLKAQKARTSDFLSKLDERFINKELSDQNYKELKSKYENQLKDIEKQIVDAELHK